MENMKQVIGKYSQIITQLQQKNRILLMQNEQYKKQLINFENKRYNIEQYYKYDQKDVKIKQLQRQLQRERMIKQNLQKKILQLKQDISILSVANPVGSRLKTDYQIQYQTLRELYEDLKAQIYNLSKQNYQLKTVIHEQFQNNNSRSQIQLHIKDRTIQKIKNHAQHNSKKKSSALLDDSQTKQSQANYKHKIRQLKKQINKQYQLLEKYKQTQQQQLQLIQLLKNQKSKVCLCHLYGVKSSKKIISQKVGKIPSSFKKIN